jgi:hypothetical protein
MAFSDFLGVLEHYRGASFSAPPPNVEQDFSKVAQAVPQGHLASGLAEAFHSGETPPFAQMIGSLFSNSDGQQRAGILNELLSAVGPGMLSSGALAGLGGLLRGGNSITPEEATRVPPQAVQQLAEHAEKQNPSIVDQASQFYAQHPTLVKTIGASALALVMSHLSRRQ